MYLQKPVRLLIAAALAVVAIAAAAPLAQAATPAPGYSQFAGCPTKAESPTTAACLRSTVKGGHFQMGTKDVPIKTPMVLTGGVDETGGGPVQKASLTKAKQLVPGGVIGLTGLDWLVNFLSIESLQLFAVTELAGTPVVAEEVITLPIKVHLVNPALGNNCYVGSSSNPITLNLTFNTTNPPPPNKPITGVIPKFSFDEATGILRLTDGEYVDNAFAAPGASGCVLTLFGFIPISINGLVNSQSGLPSPAGTNETRQIIDIELAPVGLVYP